MATKSSEITNFDAELEAVIENRRKSLKIALPPSPSKFLHVTSNGESLSMINDALLQTTTPVSSPTSSFGTSPNTDSSSINFEYHARKFTFVHRNTPLLWFDQLTILSNFVKELVDNKQLFNRILHKTANNGDGKFFVWGGIYKGALSNDLALVEMDINKKLVFSKQKQSKPANPRLFASFNYVSQKLVLIGGFDTNNTLQSDIQIASISDLNWREVIPETNKLPPIADHASASDNIDTIYIFGGVGKQDFSNTLYAYHVHENTLQVLCRSPLSQISPRAGSAMTLLNDHHLYIYGGYDNSTIFNDLYQFNVISSTFTKIETNYCSLSVPPLAMASLLSIPFKKDSLSLQGGWDGTKWNSAIFEFNESKSSWTVWTEENFDGVAYNSVSTLMDSYIVLGGTKSTAFNSAKDTVKQWNNKSSKTMTMTTEHTVKAFRMNRGVNLNENPMAELGRAYFQWFQEQHAEDSDVIFTLPLGEEEENNSLTADEHSNIIYAHKIMVERSQVLKRMIVVAEMKKYQLTEDNIDDDFVQKYKLNHGDPVTIRITYFPKVKHTRTAFMSVLQYLYSGFLDARNLSGKKNVFADIYQLAIQLKIPLLVSALSDSSHVPYEVFKSNHLKKYVDQVSQEFLKIQEEEPNIDDIESYRESLSINASACPPACLAKFVAPDFSHDPPKYKSILAHKGILKIRSPYLETLFNSSFMEAQHGVVIFEHVSIQSIFIVLKYIYSFTLNDIDASNCVEVYLTSHQFEIMDLHDKARSIIKEQELDEHTALQVLHLSESLHDKYLKDYCIFMLAKNYDEILKRDPTFFHDLTSENRSQIYKIHLTHKSKSSSGKEVK